MPHSPKIAVAMDLSDTAARASISCLGYCPPMASSLELPVANPLGDEQGGIINQRRS